MTDASQHPPGAAALDTDLVEYLIVAVPDLDSLAGVTPALAELVESAMIRILDLVVLTRGSDGVVRVLELEAVESLAALAGVDGEVGGLLSSHDIEVASVALWPDTAAVLVLTEDRWAKPLSSAARRAGGRVVGGERIVGRRVEAALVEAPGRPARVQTDQEVPGNATRRDVPE